MKRPWQPGSVHIEIWVNSDGSVALPTPCTNKHRVRSYDMWFKCVETGEKSTCIVDLMMMEWMVKVKQAGRPDSVTALYIAASRYDNHSSRRRIAPPLKLSTRTLSEPPQRVPI